MHVSELDSFVGKFNQLWKSGYTAHLDLDTQAGNAWVGLRVQLGRVPPKPFHHNYQHAPPPPRYRGPSYQRRLERRRLARSQDSPSQIPTEEVRDDNKHNTGNSEAVKATFDNIAEDLTEEVAEIESPIENNEAANEKANLPEYFFCPICDFKSKWSNGLKVHMNRRHTKLEQIDGSVDCITSEQDSKYHNTEHYWEKGHIGVAYHSFLDANRILDDCDELSNEEKVEEKNKLLDARKSVFGNSFRNYPPWKCE